MAGAPLSPLHGVPIAVEDNVAIAESRLANGSLRTADAGKFAVELNPH
jgi:Asp-tRNA(Asn)/Glu-tRNA(Gln) amidotransferase A subunit family amidase